ncbi:hypothetical protein [Hyphomicrobium sp.]|uniref:hypothetical protein n=1 Tax=Hyphomicrobium sp. TaxID=82 RepID=UPI002D7696E0|nr:hypothetical protein [Hyphomicrobium sp.]HET6388219.1 hypothetical protein [Hyphomicrobium sp.]
MVQGTRQEQKIWPEERACADACAEYLPSIIDAIQAYLDNIECGNEVGPHSIGAIEDYSRKTVILAALVLSAAKAVRACHRKSPLTTAMLLYIGLRSDNEHGRCTDSAARIADYLGCAEDVVRDLRHELVKCGALRSEPRPGHPVALWLPYVAPALQSSPHAILVAMAPARSAAGRPRKSQDSAVSAKTSGILHPTFSEEEPRACNARPFPEKGRVLDEKTPGVGIENPGHLMPDCKNSSLQELNTRTRDLCADAHPDDAFEEFWQAFPTKRRRDKVEARKTFMQILTGKHANKLRAKAEDIIAAVKAGRGFDPEEPPMPTTWLNKGRWLDDDPREQTAPDTRPWWQVPERVAAARADPERLKGFIRQSANRIWPIDKLGPPHGQPGSVVTQSIAEELGLVGTYDQRGMLRPGKKPAFSAHPSLDALSRGHSPGGGRSATRR